MLKYEDLTLEQKKELLRLLNSDHLSDTLKLCARDNEQYREKKFKKRNVIYKKISEGYFNEVLNR